MKLISVIIFLVKIIGRAIREDRTPFHYLLDNT